MDTYETGKPKDVPINDKFGTLYPQTEKSGRTRKTKDQAKAKCAARRSHITSSSGST